ncbi:MAG TPA: 2-amino-4-hydroxy-6-hydroxymethyldihydropteridine diphosphokinase [Longimicrobiales bacterium]|nr:2-amino-4-hydroxy-6-hydroxymethyldihydropteridine diphosphokinase [Longimicrobiales bacterium]
MPEAREVVYIGLGSNQGERESHLRAAVDALARMLDVEVVSSVYETEPVGFREQPDFLNLAVRARTDLEPAALLAELLRIERELGRTRRFPNAPRTIDIDLLMYGERVVDLPQLIVPHPRMTGRAFTLLPLIEIDPGLVHPGTGERLTDLLARDPLERAKRVGSLGRIGARVFAAVGVALAALLGACNGGGNADEGPDPQLEAMIDSILPRIERVTGMPSRAEIRAERRGREELRQYLEQRMVEEMPAEELRRIQLLYQELGMLPDSLDLRALLLDLLTEQVVGYYDPPTKTLYLVQGADDATTREVLAHELVHALQDQYVDLDSLLSPGLENDRATAAQAAIEGHATLVMFALMLQERTGDARDITSLPDIGRQLRPALEAGNDQMPVFRDAPRIIRETLIFPYLAGAGFVQAAWAAHEGEGRPPFESIIPTSTEQVLHVRTHWIAERDHPTRVSLAPPVGDWRVVHEEVLGELELGLFLREHLGTAMDQAVAGWDGDVARLIESGLGERALVLGSVWDSAADADEFADAYRRTLSERRARHGSVERSTVDGREVVIVIDAPTGVPASLLPTASVASLSVD